MIQEDVKYSWSPKEQGIFDYHQGVEEDACPYPKGDTRRKSWYDGYLQESIQSRVGHIMEGNNDNHATGN